MSQSITEGTVMRGTFDHNDDQRLDSLRRVSYGKDTDGAHHERHGAVACRPRRCIRKGKGPWGREMNFI